MTLYIISSTFIVYSVGVCACVCVLSIGTHPFHRYTPYCLYSKQVYIKHNVGMVYIMYVKAGTKTSVVPSLNCVQNEYNHYKHKN